MYSGVFRLMALYPSQEGVQKIEIYGYCSKGLPGLEIVGLGSLGRSVKEKLIFLSRQFGIKIPLKRYVLCVELSTQLKKTNASEESRWLELPMMILFWTLSGNLELGNLEDCASVGKVQVNGTILFPEIKTMNLEKDYKVIAPSFIDVPENCYLIPLEELLSCAGAESFNYKHAKLRAS